MWPSLCADLREVRRVLKIGGALSIAVHQWADRYASDRGDSDRPWDEHIVAELQRSGFHVIETRNARALSGRALYVLAQSL